MIKLFNCFKRNLLVKRSFSSNQKKIVRHIHHYNFETDEEIIENLFGKVMLIGINLPDTKNVLTERAVEKLCESFNNFAKTDELSVAILHGIGGNFCTGLEQTERALKKSLDLMEILNRINKPVIGSLNGHTINFGFHLAIMCDIRVMDETGLAGFGEKFQRSDMQDFLFERLVLSVGLSKAMELITLRVMWSGKQCYESNFVNRAVNCGCSLGQSLSWGQSIAQDPLETINSEKSKVLSFLSTRSPKVQ